MHCYRARRTCHRFKVLVGDRFLWSVFDFADQPMTASEIQKRFVYLTEKTHTFRVAGLKFRYPTKMWKNTTLTRTALDRLVAKCPQLLHMSVEAAHIDVEAVGIHEHTDRIDQTQITK